MHERQLPVDESTLGLLKSFLGKVSQDYASLQNEFEYLKDESVRIKGNTERTIRTQERTIVRSESSKEQNTDDEIEIIELDDKDCNKNGFWNRKCSNMMITKFDNFLPDEDNDDDIINTSAYMPTLMSMKDSETPSSRVEQVVEKEDADADDKDDDDDKQDIEIDTSETIMHQYYDKRFPGEYDDYDDDENVNRVERQEDKKQQLDISSQFCHLNKQGDKDDEDSSKQEFCCDLVEPFELDSTHDYSQNVVKSKYDIYLSFKEGSV